MWTLCGIEHLHMFAYLARDSWACIYTTSVPSSLDSSLISLISKWFHHCHSFVWASFEHLLKFLFRIKAIYQVMQSLQLHVATSTTYTCLSWLLYCILHLVHLCHVLHGCAFFGFEESCHHPYTSEEWSYIRMGMDEYLISHLLVIVASSNCFLTALIIFWNILVSTSVLCLDTMLMTFCVGTGPLMNRIVACNLYYDI